MLELPLVVLFEQDGADAARDGCLVGKHADHVGAALHLLVQPLGWLSDPTNQFYGVNLLGYNSSKSALNAVTVSLAKELATAGIRVNAADPGYTATDFNGHSGCRTVEQAAAGIVWLAGLHEGGPTGGFYFERERVPW